MHQRFFRALTLLALVWVSTTTAFAIPTLQLNIGGGSYNSTTQTIVAGSDPFRLFAYLIPDSDSLANSNYFLSMALTPRVGPAAGNYGTVKVNGNTVNVTADMTYGTPPAGALDLQSHGIFQTFYKEYGFNFVGDSQTNPFNVQDFPGRVPSAGAGMYYHSWDIDTTGLDSHYEVHFDLYQIGQVTHGRNTSTDIVEFAPFSHDAESGPGDNVTTHDVPEPSTLMLFGTGFVALGAAMRRRQ